MPSEEGLIEMFKTNAEKAFAELYNRYSPVLYGICLRYSKNEADAEDILQETFITVFNKIKQYRSEGSLEGWLKRIAVNTSINFYRKKIRLGTVSNDDIFFDFEIEETVFSKLTNDELVNLIRQMPEGYRMVFNLYVIEGYKHNEIADMLGVSESTSKTQLLKAKKYLKALVLKTYPEIAKAYLNKDNSKLIFDF